ncbi:MAG: hypothetical protein A2Z72_05990 [Omnitrophica bacterium RBG_13_46_9]|nr:MAG: hypothetical protein A2Z72_05990 [Omnitrophica bacterium RBG_13_46_9]
MKILIFSYYLPHNDIDQYTLRIHLKTLSQDNEIILVCGVRKGEEGLLEDTRKYCAKVYAVKLDLPNLSWRLKDISAAFLLRGTMNCLRFLPPAKLPWDRLLIMPLFFFFRKELSDRLKEAFQREKPDLVHFHKIITSAHREDIPRHVPSVFFDDDAISRLFYASMIAEKSFPAKAYYLIRYLGAKKWEKLILPSFKKVVILSENDRKWLTGINPFLSNVEPIHYVVDTELFKPAPVTEDFPSVIFFGTLSLSYNREAAEYFAGAILPLIRKEIPQLRFYIVGPDPSLKIRSLSKNPLNKVVSKVTGHAEDLRGHIAKSAVCIVPLNKTVGVKSRILIAMSMAKTVVATSAAAQGVEGLKDGENIIIADTPSLFAEKVVYLIRNREVNNGIGVKARELIIREYCSRRWKEQWETIYRSLIKT